MVGEVVFVSVTSQSPPSFNLSASPILSAGLAFVRLVESMNYDLKLPWNTKVMEVESPGPSFQLQSLITLFLFRIEQSTHHCKNFVILLVIDLLL